MASSDDLTNYLMLEGHLVQDCKQTVNIDYRLVSGVSSASNNKNRHYLEERPLAKDGPRPFKIT